MEYYLAPLEGITGYMYRNTVNRYFGEGISKYFTPFFQPHRKRSMYQREMKDIFPENNAGIKLVPQILTNDPQDFLQFEKDMGDFGYKELNINLGCPSGTVTSKGRGSAFLKDTDGLKFFLDGVFSKTQAAVSIKTRIGAEDPAEFAKILDIYNSYPVYELIIHPRVKTEMYSGRVHMDIFEYASDNACMPLCYNGDIWDTASVPQLKENVRAVMCGRGMVGNPALIRELSGGSPLMKKEFDAFMEELFEVYIKVFSGVTPVLHKMKEIWVLTERYHKGSEKLYKAVYKSKNETEYKAAVKRLLESW